MELAPIVLFVYNRPWHTQKCLEALCVNELAKDSTLYIYADGIKPNATSKDIENILEVRTICKNISGFKTVHIVEKEKNFGLVNSINDGVTEVINKHSSIIVLEDDLIVSVGFIRFMNEALKIYKDQKHIYSVTGYMFNINTEIKKTVLLPFTSTWSWGTWKDRWSSFSIDNFKNDVISDSKSLTSRFNLGDYDYTKMLESGSMNSWGIKWYYHVFKRNGLNLFPTKSLVSNTGFDGSGTNCGTSFQNSTELENEIEVNLYSEMDLSFLKSYLSYFETTKNKKNNLRETLRSIFKN